MEQYAGLDVSLKAVSICVSDGAGTVLWRGEVLNDAAAVVAMLGRHAPGLVRAVLETGSCGVHLYRGLKAASVPIVCICARQAKGALKSKVNKTDANDAEGLVHLARTGWYREVYVKSTDAHELRALLRARQQLGKARRDFENQMRAMLRVFGLKVGQVSRGRFEERVRELLIKVPALHIPLDQLLMARRSLLRAHDGLDDEAKRMARADERCQLLQTMPGIGPLSSLAFVAALDGAARFAKSSSVGAYLGLTPRTYQSGEVAWTGRISKQGDSLSRTLLYEAANSLLVRFKAKAPKTAWPPLKLWAHELAAKVGAKKARVALARKMAVILHRMLADGTAYRWTPNAA